MFRLIALSLIVIIGGGISLYLQDLSQMTYNLVLAILWNFFLCLLIGVVLAVESVKVIKKSSQIKIAELIFGMVFIILPILPFIDVIYLPILVSMSDVSIIVGAYLITSSFTTKK